MNSSNTTSFDHIARLSDRYTGSICIPIILLGQSCIFTLSLIWSFYIIYQMMRDKQIFKRTKKLKNIMRESEFTKIVDNTNIRRVKNLFFLVICLCECGIPISILLDFVFNIDRGHDQKLEWPHSLPYYSFRNSFYHSLFFISRRITVIILFMFFYSIIAYARLLSEFLCCKYDYYETKPYLCIRILLSFCIALVLMLIGLFRQLFLFSFIGILLAQMYQFIQLCFAVRKLKRSLYKRLFDAQYLECQPLYVVNYFRRAHWNFKYASAILLIALFLQMLGYSILYIHSIITMFVYFPHTWLNTILYGTDETFHSSIFTEISEAFTTDLVYIIITLGTILQVLPYLFVSIRLLCRNIGNKFGKIENKYDYFQIKAMITRNNDAYLRNHFIA